MLLLKCVHKVSGNFGAVPLTAALNATTRYATSRLEVDQSNNANDLKDFIGVTVKKEEISNNESSETLAVPFVKSTSTRSLNRQPVPKIDGRGKTSQW